MARLLERSGDPLAMLPDEVSQDYLRDQVVIIGHGEVGRRITRSLMEENIKVVIAEENRDIVENLRKKVLLRFPVLPLKLAFSFRRIFSTRAYWSFPLWILSISIKLSTLPRL